MQFLNPALLFGLVAAAIPVLLHFLSRRRVTEIPFAPLRFLISTREKQMRRMSLRRLLLLLLRVLIIVLLVLAAARPVLTSGVAGGVGRGEGTSVVLLIDDSASMQAEVTGGNMFDRAREEAARIVEALDSRDEVAVLGFGQSTRSSFSEFIGNRELVLSALDEMECTAESTDYMHGLDAALEFLDRGTRPRREIYVLGDFQESPVDSLALARWHAGHAADPPVAIFLRPVATEAFVNREIAAFERPASLLRARETTEIRVDVSQDGRSPQQVPVFLDIDGTTIAETELNLPAGGTHRQSFPLTLPDAGDLGATARMRPDRYPLDDAMHAVLAVSERVDVLVLRGIEQLPGEGDPLLFLLSALDPERNGSGRFAPRVEDARHFDVERLATTPVVLLVNPKDVGAARRAALTSYLEGGGTILMFAGDPRVQPYVDGQLLPGWGLPGLGVFRKNAGTRERLEFTADDHVAFDAFDAEARATLSEATVHNFYRLPDEFGQPLMAWADGGTAIVEAAVGEGRLILCAFDPSATSGELVYSPMFLPLVQRLTAYLATAGWGRFAREFLIGERVGVEAPEGSGTATRVELVGSDGSRRRATLDAASQPPRVRVDEVSEPGLYHFQADGANFATVAVNVDRSESRRVWWTAGQFASTFGHEDSPLRFQDLGGGEVADLMATARSGRPLHAIFLWLAGVLLVLESLLGRNAGSASKDVRAEDR